MTMKFRLFGDKERKREARARTIARGFAVLVT